MEKSRDAFRTISEVAEWLDTPAHVLRFWESRFTQVKPVKRAGGRRYYRPNDMLLLGGIKQLLHEDGLTIRGAQKYLREHGIKEVSALSQPLDDGDVIDATVADTVADAPMAEDVQPAPETAVDNVISMPTREAEKASPPPAHEPKAEPEAPQLDLGLGDEVTPAATAEPEDAPEPVMEPAAEAEPETPAKEVAEVAPEPEAVAEPEPEPEPKPESAEAEAPAAEIEPESEPASEPEPAAAEEEAAPIAASGETPQPLGTDLPDSDPADDDAAFDGPVPLSAVLRKPAVARKLAKDNAEALHQIHARLSALKDSMARG